jgi:hypothetical protein
MNTVKLRLYMFPYYQFVFKKFLWRSTGDAYLSLTPDATFDIPRDGVYSMFCCIFPAGLTTYIAVRYACHFIIIININLIIIIIIIIISLFVSLGQSQICWQTFGFTSWRWCETQKILTSEYVLLRKSTYW